MWDQGMELKRSYGKKNGSCENVHTGIPGICEYVTLCGKRKFADVIKFVDLKIGKLS